MNNRSIECRRHVELEATLRLALEALEWSTSCMSFDDFDDMPEALAELNKVHQAITAIKEALMSQSDGAQSAVAEQHKQELFLAPNNFYKDVDEAINKLDKNGSIFDGNDSAPYVVWLLRTLRELATQTQPKETEQEPVEWVARNKDIQEICELLVKHGAMVGKANAGPYLIWLIQSLNLNCEATQRKPLGYVDLRRIANQCGLGANEVSARTQATVDNFARAIEAAHGIKE